MIHYAHESHGNFTSEEILNRTGNTIRHCREWYHMARKGPPIYSVVNSYKQMCVQIAIFFILFWCFTDEGN